MANSLGTQPALLPKSPPVSTVEIRPQRRNDTSLADEIFSSTLIPTIVLDASLVICQVSDSFLEVSGGCRRENVLGLDANDFFHQAMTFFHPLASARKAIHSAQETKRPYELEDVEIDGKAAWSVRAVPIYRDDSLRYIQMEVKDVTEEHQRLLELEERLSVNETFRVFVETVKDYAIFMLDPTGHVATWNAGAQVFKGYTREEILGKHFSIFYGPEDADTKPPRELHDALKDGRVEDEGWRYRKDGSRFWANVVITPVYRDNILVGFGKVTRDLTERRKTEEQLVAAYEESSKLKSEFLANMSHEIRTPMHGMLSALTLLLDTKLDEPQMELAKVIEESGEVLLHVINDILDYSKLASGSFSISADIICVPDICQSVFRVYEKGRKEQTLLEHHLDPRLPRAAEGDSFRYRQIIQNLMSNATKFTEEGYVKLNVSLQDEDDDSYLILTEVVDSGIGIPRGMTGALFNPFTQFDNSATKRYKGTGLGLSICKSLAELMGGEIGFRPNLDGRGSIFWFTARLKKVRQLKHIEAMQEKIESLAIDTPISPFEDIQTAAVGKRVLIAEDNQINQKVMVKMLKGLGFDSVDLAADGRAAVNMAVKEPPPYNIILMDINMPFLDGVTATKEIRSAMIQTPIVAMTANALKGQAESYIAKGMTDYISKPVDRKRLVKILTNALEQDAQRTQREPG
ncbi:sensor histidine kinase-like protein/response regulator Fos-1 [Lophiotrema nucula]|uniref:Sensor histidine kinase-like protein/response regulator Fos-1 n=1 Tax=Lophiotrema nucula TaxID=690887 RepID=A0A6A5YKJ4_9PLEO|nr:sensor histidine kinase-like protein/response regulator Fos-1 [Lophiotrema nucula]